MKKQFVIFLTLTLSILLLATCSKDNFSLNETPQLPATLYDYEAVTMGSFNNPVTNEGATLGRVLFYDTKLSLNNSVSCGTCHKQSNAFSDGKKFSKGFEGQITKRNAPGLTNLIAQNLFFWDLRTPDLETLALQPVENHIEMGMEDADALVQKLRNYDYYQSLFEDAFGTPEITKERIAKAMTQFMWTLQSYDTKYDRFLDEEESLSVSETLGAELFFSWEGAGCVNCHSGSNFSGWGTNAANIGLDMEYTDNGRGDVEGNDSGSNGVFKVPGLRNLMLTAPYMHDGRYNTLEEVVEHYSSGIQPHPNLSWSLRDPNIETEVVPMNRNFTDVEKTALIDFLKTLTDTNFVTDSKFSNPFDY